MIAPNEIGNGTVIGAFPPGLIEIAGDNYVAWITNHEQDLLRIVSG